MFSFLRIRDVCECRGRVCALVDRRSYVFGAGLEQRPSLRRFCLCVTPTAASRLVTRCSAERLTTRQKSAEDLLLKRDAEETLVAPKSDWDTWRSFQFSTLLLCIHVTLSSGVLSVAAAVLDVPLDDLTPLQLSSVGVACSVLQLYAFWRTDQLFRTAYDLPATQLVVRPTTDAAVNGLIFAVAAATLVSIISWILPPPDQSPGELLLVQSQDVSGRNVEIASAVVLSPAMEEYLHRGLILESLLTVLPVRDSVVISALLFSVSHFSPSTFLSHFVFGAFFATAYVRSGRNLFAPMAAHSLANVAAVATCLLTR